MHALIPEVPRVFPHVHTEVMLPLGDVATLSAHVILGVGVGQHVLGQVAHVPACEITEFTLMRFLTLGVGGSRERRGGNRSDVDQGSAQTIPPPASLP